MATQTIEFRSPPSQTVTAKLFAIGSDTQVDSQSATEATNRKGTYSAAFTDVAAGQYELIAFVSTTPVARWFVTLTLTTATFQVYDSTVEIAIKAVTDDLAASASVIIPGTVSTAVLSPTTSAFAADDITEATADHYLGRSLIFTSGALLGQATRITGYSLVSAEGRFTVVALTEAPANNDTFIIV